MFNDDIKFEILVLFRDLCINDFKYVILVVNNGFWVIYVFIYLSVC